MNNRYMKILSLNLLSFLFSKLSLLHKAKHMGCTYCAYNPCMHRSYTCTMKHRSHTLFVHIPPDSAGKNNGKSTIHKKLNWLSGINFTPCKHKMIRKMKNCACMVHVYIFGEYILNVNNSQMNIK